MKEKWGRAFRIVIVGVLVLFAGFMLRPKPRLLLSVARPIAKVQSLSDDEPTYDSWTWLSDRDLLLLTTDRDLAGSVSWKGRVEILNVATGSRTALPELAAQLQRVHSNSARPPQCLEMSPDRSWVVWNEIYPTGILVRGAARIDGSGYRTWKEAFASVTFFADNAHLVEYPDTNDTSIRLTVHDLRDAKRDRRYSLIAPEAQNILKLYRQRELFSMSAVPGQANPERFLDVNVYRNADLAVAPADGLSTRFDPTQAIQHYVIQLPEDARRFEHGANQETGAIYYDMAISRSFTIIDWFQVRFPRLFGERKDEEEGLWVSRRDGKGLHEIGHLPASIENNTDIGTLQMIQWLPGGKQISFVYGDTLYLVDADVSK